MRYNIIYADPPWKYAFSQSKSRSLDNQYPQMDIKDIKKLPVSDMSENDAVLILWVTFPKLLEGIETLKAWGFTYTTMLFTWVKKYKSGKNFFGMGYYTRSNTEICLLGKKGIGIPALNHSISCVIESEWTKHSQKPDIVRDNIVTLFGDLPRIELFARKKTEGWDVWGNEV